MKIETKSANAPAAIGPYSQAISFGGFTFISGQLPIDPATGVMPDGIEAQTRTSLNNVQAILQEAGMEMKDVLKTTVYL
ncbi:MAG: Rid family hydrolase, partial [Lawsonibacter sp.]|nr:Rid family hydrolase [Lawsonibacter sp.]